MYIYISREMENTVQGNARARKGYECLHRDRNSLFCVRIVHERSRTRRSDPSLGSGKRGVAGRG
jgi:hypothetical protein